MKDIVVDLKEIPDLKDPILIEGLPGVGLVAQIIGEHLIKELDAKPFAEIYSPDFPHCVLMNSDGTIMAMKNVMYYYRGKQDLVFLGGNVQSPNPIGSYNIVEKILDICEKIKVKEIITLAGWGIGAYEKPKIYAVSNTPKLLEKLSKHDVEPKGFEGNSILGVAGLLVGLGGLRNIDGCCLLGTTPGDIVDPRAAEAVLKVLLQILELDVDLTKLEKRAKKTEKLLKTVQNQAEQLMFKETQGQETEIDYV